MFRVRRTWVVSGVCALLGSLAACSTTAEPDRTIAVPGSDVRIELWPGDQFRISLDPELRMRPTSYRVQLAGVAVDPLRAGLPVQSYVDREQGNLYLVQFFTPPIAEYRAHMASLGARAHQYVPGDVHLVEMNAAVAAEIGRQPYVRWVGPYRPSYRMPPLLVADLETRRDQIPIARYNILLREPGPMLAAAVADRVRALGGTLELMPTRGAILSATLPAEALAAIAALDEVLYLDAWTPPAADMDLARQISGADFIEGVAGFTGQGVTGEVMDGNVLEGHRDFASRPVILHGDRTGDDYHGTATTGIVFGDGALEPKGRGVLPSGQPIFASYEVVGDRRAHTAELLTPQYGAVFQSNSWGDDLTTEYTTISAEMDAMLFELDLPLFQSQSNAGSTLSRPQAWAKNIISVGGFEHGDTLDLGDDGWNFSASIGPAADGRIKPDLSHFVDATWAPSSTGGYEDFGGTSGATPITAGHAGLFLQMWAAGVFGNVPAGPTVFEARPHMTTTKAVLINTASAHPFSGEDDDLGRVHQGWGRVDLRRLYEARDKILVVDQADVLPLFGVARYEIAVADADESFRATLVFPDPAGVPGAGQARINDLTLKVIAPSGTEYFGNHGLLAAGVSSPGGAASTIDTVENVIVADPEPGTWTVEVSADEINADGHVETPELDADFSLVVSRSADAGPQPPGRVVLAQVSYDPTGVEADEEFVELHNPTRADLDLGGWTIHDGNSSFTLPPGTVIAAGGYLSIAADAAGFTALFGVAPGVAGLSTRLNNAGDVVRLTDAASQEVDMVAWGGAAVGWSISAGSGQALVRNPGPDTDTEADWTVAPAQPR